MNRRGFTLIEMFIVIAVMGILASLALIKSAQYRSRALRTTMVSDLKNLISAQEAFNIQNHDYAGGTTLGAELPGTGGSGQATFRASGGNQVTVIYHGTDGWTATVTNSGLTDAPQRCGVFIGPVSYSPNANVFYEGQPGCW